VRAERRSIPTQEAHGIFNLEEGLGGGRVDFLHLLIHRIEERILQFLSVSESGDTRDTKRKKNAKQEGV
jgi:hypothetical protein